MAADSRVLEPWLCFESEGKIKLSPVFDRAMVGLAVSNHIVLSGKGIRPLHGQFAISSGEIYFTDFQERQSLSLSPDKSFFIGNWKVHLSNRSDLFQTHQSNILRSFKEHLKESPQKNFENILPQLASEWFASKEVPDELKNLLKAQMSELYLSGPIESYLSDSSVTDILVEAWNCIWIERKGEMQKGSSVFTSSEAYLIYIENLLKQMHQTIDEAQPYLDFKLPDGSRGHLIASPLTDGTHYLSIRKIREKMWTLNELKENEMFSDHFFRTILKLIEGRSNIIISGATGSGKTSLLKALLGEIPVQERMIVLEDTSELRFSRENAAFLCVRTKTLNSLPEIHLRDLVKQSLRMRPDRIVIGEVRGEEALDLLHAMNTGHRGCMGSLHANSTRDAIYRLQGLIQMSQAALSETSTSDLLARNIHAVIHCSRDEQGRRRVVEIAFVRGRDAEQIILETQRA